MITSKTMMTSHADMDPYSSVGWRCLPPFTALSRFLYWSEVQPLPDSQASALNATAPLGEGRRSRLRLRPFAPRDCVGKLRFLASPRPWKGRARDSRLRLSASRRREYGSSAPG